MDTIDSSPRLRNASKMSNLEVDLIAVKSYQNIPRLLFICLLLSLSPFYFGFNFAVLSNVQTDTYKTYFGETAAKSSTIGSLIGLLAIGGGIGSLCAPFFMKKLTRRQFVIVFDILAIINAGLIQVNNLPMLAVCKLMQGFIIGNYMSIIPIYINQLTPIQIRGSFGAMTQISIMIAIVTCFTLGVVFSFLQDQQFVWRFLFSITGLTTLIQLVFILTGFIPQSPVSLIERGFVQQAKKYLLLFNTKNAISRAFEDVQSKAVKPEILKVQIDETEGAEVVKIQQKKFQIPVLKKAVFLAFQLPFMLQMSGTSALVTEIAVIFAKDKNLALYSPLIANVVQLIATLGSLFTLSYFGRRPLLVFGNISLGIVDIVLAVMLLLSTIYISDRTYDYVVLGFIMVFMILYGFTIGPIVWLYVPQIIPARLVPPATFMNWFGMFISVIMIPFISNAVGNAYPVFFIFGGISLILGCVNVVMMKQTKGLTPRQIAEQFKN